MKTETQQTERPSAVRSHDLLARIKADLKKSEPEMDENDESFKAAVVLLASARIGTSQSTLHKVTGYSRPQIAKFSHYLKKSGIWRGRKVYAEWADKENGVIAFWCDVLTAQGILERSR